MIGVLKARGGSSPLTRGKHPIPRGRYGARRLIPAHAGKTYPGPRQRRQEGAHPRSRGENTEVTALLMPIAGSSPLTRGKPDPVDSATHVWRLIPAHAGKTLPGKASTRPHRAHPRSRGENWLRRRPVPCRSGSSPLTRGKQRKRRHPLRRPGLIPAHAGKTGSVQLLTTAAQAHPRSRGENRERLSAGRKPGGSSPLTRGKPTCSI